MLFKVFVFLIVIGVVFRLINKYIRPVLHITSATSDHLRKMQEQMNQMNERMQPPPQQEQKKRVKKEGDYIDYEEVK